MFKKTSLRLAVLAVLLFAQSQVSGNPVIENENKDGIQAAATRDARISPSDWLHFNRSWSFPSLPSVAGLFSGDDKEGRGFNLRKRVDALEKTQKSINEILKNLTRDVSALKASWAEKVDGWPVVPDEFVTDIPEIADGFLSLPERVLPENPATDEPEIAAEFPSLPERVLPEQPEAAEETGEDTLMVIPLKTTGNATSSLSSGGTGAPEVPEKIVIASTSLADNPGENPFGSISLVGFAPSHDSRLNSRMPLNNDHKSN